MNDTIEKLLQLQTLKFDDATDTAIHGKIEELRGEIPTQILGHYDRLVARGKKGVAALRNQVCTGCHVQVPLATTLTLMRGDDIRICDSCGRYLYLAKPAEAPKVAKREGKSQARSKRGLQLQEA